MDQHLSSSSFGIKNLRSNSLLHERWCCVLIKRIGPEPTTDRFMAIIGPNEQVTPGNALAVNSTRQFGALQSFGNTFLGRFEASFLPSPVLRSITIIDTPGISGEKQRLHRGYSYFLVFDTQEKPTNFQMRVQSNNRLMLPPTLSLCILLLIFRLLLQSGDIEANPGPTLASILTSNDLKSVYKNLIKAAGNWFDLGLDLGLGVDILSNIRDEHRDNQTCLREMLTARIKTGHLTYSEICRSLRESTVNRNDVAEAIEEACTDDDTSPGPSKRHKFPTTNPGPSKSGSGFAVGPDFPVAQVGIKSTSQGSNHGYNTLMECHIKVCKGLSSDSSNIAQSLHGKGLISAALMEEVRTLPGTKLEKGNRLYTAILECVKASRNKYSDFMSVLEKNKVLHSDLLITLRNRHFKICNESVKEKVENTNKVIKTVISIAKKLEMYTHSQELERISSALESDTVQIGFVGLTNAGKSTTANSFIGSPFFPPSFRRQTDSSIRIVHHPKLPNGELVGRQKYSDGLVRLASGVESVQSFIEKLNIDDCDKDIHYSELILYAPVAILSEIKQTFAPEILEMPGTSDTFTSQKTTAAAKTALKSLAAIILVVSADDVSKGAVTELVEGIKTLHPGLMEKQNRILVLINKYDLCYDGNKFSWTPEKLQMEMAEQIGISIEQTVCFSATFAQEAQKWLRDPSAVTKDMYGKKYYDLRLTPECDTVGSLEKYTKENVKKLAEVLEKFSGFQEVKTKLQWALCVNGSEILLESAVDDCRGEISKMEAAITQKKQELDIQGKEKSVEEQRAQVKTVSQFLQNTCEFKTSFPKMVAQSFAFKLNTITSKLVNDISTQAFFNSISLKKEHDNEQYVLQCVERTRQTMLKSAEDKVNNTCIVGIAEMKEILSIKFKSMLKGLQQDLVIHQLTDLLDFNGVDPNKLLDTLVFPSVKQPDFVKCTAISDEAIRPAIRPSTRKRQKHITASMEFRCLVFSSATIEYSKVVNYDEKVFEIDFESLNTSFKQLAEFCSKHVQTSLREILEDVTSKLSQALMCELQKLSKEPIQLKKNELEVTEEDLQNSKKEITKFKNAFQALMDADRKLRNSVSPAGKKRAHEEASSSIKKPAPKKPKPSKGRWRRR
ncbi:uncharacterized protein LOC135347354 isoform X2 [Halichondria panicea]|uniref:uncharacterized protein LOC135347354 isoform X2 n=1 Tax=Halichondria panicea TaxID=6063 RepID=UPI00312B7F78